MTSPDRTTLGVAGALSAGAGLVHLGVAAEHARHHWSMGAAFLLVGWAQLGWPFLAWVRGTRGPVVAGAAVQLAAIGGLVGATTVGWPVGPLAGQPESVTTAALVCLVLQLSSLAACLALLVGQVRLPRAVLPAVVVAVVACTSAAVAVGPSHPATDAVASAHHESPPVVAAAAGTAIDAAAGPASSAGDAAASADEPAHAADPGEHADAAPPQGSAAEGAQPPASGHGHGPVDTTPPTAAQKAAADALLRSTQTAMQRYAVASVAEAEGYKVVHDAGGKLLHYAHPGHQKDGTLLDPQRIESLLYVVLPGGGKLLVGGMYMAPKGQRGPAIGGSLTQWHAHDDLCLDPVKGIAITQRPGGGCPPGSAVGTTGEMMHVWAIDYPGGPFGELEAGALRQAVLDHFGVTPANG